MQIIERRRKAQREKSGDDPSKTDEMSRRESAPPTSAFWLFVLNGNVIRELHLCRRSPSAANRGLFFPLVIENLDRFSFKRGTGHTSHPRHFTWDWFPSSCPA
jgi:hypothetical protein